MALFLTGLLCSAGETGGLSKQDKRIGRMMFYNVENLFDTVDDPLTDDDEFTPDGLRKWTPEKYRTKCNHLAWVISNVGEWGFPAVVGLAEVENSQVLDDLLASPALRQVRYDYTVTHSSDPRGVDVALLWDRDRLTYIDAREIPQYGTLRDYPIGNDPRSRQEAAGTGRNTLWVTLKHKSTSRTLDLFVLHNPSRRGGVAATSAKRIEINTKVRGIIDSLLTADPARNIVLMGDFNDNPSDPSLRKALGAGGIEENTPIRPDRLYNLAFPLYNSGKGTHRFEGKLWMPDQLIVSGGLFLGASPLLTDRQLTIFRHDQLFTRRGDALRRTYNGPYYNGGYSDHLPIYIDLH
ncbi:MAG: hypothetical protein Q4E10_03185 [Porphyromonas sp.]|nr:hypothetical protein [Porphyromonas sp.]